MLIETLAFAGLAVFVLKGDKIWAKAVEAWKEVTRPLTDVEDAWMKAEDAWEEADYEWRKAERDWARAEREWGRVVALFGASLATDAERERLQRGREKRAAGCRPRRMPDETQRQKITRARVAWVLGQKKKQQEG